VVTAHGRQEQQSVADQDRHPGIGLGRHDACHRIPGKGHPVMIGSRNPAKLNEWLKETGHNARVRTSQKPPSSVTWSSCQVNGRAAEDAIRLARVENLTGKIVLDASDPLDFSSGQPGLFVGTRLGCLLAWKAVDILAELGAYDITYGWHQPRSDAPEAAALAFLRA
jgi:hypothetical protein